MSIFKHIMLKKICKKNDGKTNLLLLSKSGLKERIRTYDVNNLYKDYEFDLVSCKEQQIKNII